jgi:hypothetical protein
MSIISSLKRRIKKMVISLNLDGPIFKANLLLILRVDFRSKFILRVDFRSCYFAFICFRSTDYTN